MAKTQWVSDQQAVAWVSRHKAGILSVVAGVFLGENWFVRQTGLYLPFSGMILFALLAYGVRYLAGLAWWWNRRRILLAKYDKTPPGPLEMLRQRHREQRFRSFVAKQWAAWCQANGYLGSLKTVPALHSVRIDYAGDLTAHISPGSLHVKAPKGLTAVEHLRTMTPSLAEATKCENVGVRNTGPSGALVTFFRSDPLARILPIADLPEAPADQIAFGITASGVATIPMSMHALMGGMSGYGKSSWLHALLADLNRKGIKYVVDMIDPKRGAEFKEMRPHVGTWSGNRLIKTYCRTGEDESIDVLNSVVHDLKERQDIFEGRKWTPADADEHPLRLLVIDECLEVFETWGEHKPDTRTAKGKPMRDFTKVLLSQGRAAGFMVIAATQTAEVSALGPSVRRMFPKRYAVATDNATGTNMILGDSAETDGARASKIVHPGRGYGMTEGKRGYEEFRIAWAEDEDRERIAAGIVPLGMGEGGKEAVNRMTAVYRFFSHIGELLYVGKTVDVAARFAQHAADKPWWVEVDMSKTLVTWHPSEAAALRVEEQEIKSRLPRYNKQHNGANPLARAYVKPEPAEPAQPLTQRALRLVRPERREPQPWEFRPVRVTPKRRRKPAPAKTATVQPAPAAYLNATRSPSAPAAYTRTLKETA